jgi:hypothetical protein
MVDFDSQKCFVSLEDEKKGRMLLFNVEDGKFEKLLPHVHDPTGRASVGELPRDAKRSTPKPLTKGRVSLSKKTVTGKSLKNMYSKPENKRGYPLDFTAVSLDNDQWRAPETQQRASNPQMRSYSSPAPYYDSYTILLIITGLIFVLILVVCCAVASPYFAASGGSMYGAVPNPPNYVQSQTYAGSTPAPPMSMNTAMPSSF